MEKLQQFLEDIHGDYEWELYICEYIGDLEEKYRVQFPFCCQLSAQLIGSFLYAHGYQDVKCIYAHGMCPPHYWCEYNDLIIDYTDFQFEKLKESGMYDKMHDYEFERNELLDYVRQFPILYSPDYREPNAHTHRIMAWPIFDEIPLQLIEEAANYPFTKDAFLDFVNEYAPFLQKTLEYHF